MKTIANVTAQISPRADADSALFSVTVHLQDGALGSVQNTLDGVLEPTDGFAGPINGREPALYVPQAEFNMIQEIVGVIAANGGVHPLAGVDAGDAGQVSAVIAEHHQDALAVEWLTQAVTAAL